VCSSDLHVLGRSDLTLKLLGVVRGPARKQKFYSFCKLSPKRLPHPQIFRSVKASSADLPALTRLYAKSDILANYETRLPALLRSGTAYLAKEGDGAVSCALTTTETPEMAMIGAVFTDETHRNRGLATDCMVNLCRDLAARGKEVYLFYERDNPLLGRLYAKMGFTITGEWVVATIA
jgi:predicted GNAT family acetyltransferase